MTDAQRTVAEATAGPRVLVTGPVGTGKTTAAVGWLQRRLEEGVGQSTIVVLPQLTLAQPYLLAVRGPGRPAGPEVSVTTVGGLARRMVELFWPVIAGGAGFHHADGQPTFLTLETAQYFMARVAGPKLDSGFFETVTIHRNRIYSQILDNLNKSAVVGFPVAEIGVRLTEAWSGDPAQTRVYQDAQECAQLFRDYCLERNLLDFSLQYELFVQHVLPRDECWKYLCDSCSCVLVDNVEEDTPGAHDLLVRLVQQAEHALVVHDQDAGYRRLLGADPQGVKRFAEVLPGRVELTERVAGDPAVQTLAASLARALDRPDSHTARPEPQAAEVLRYQHHRYYPQMLDWVAARVRELVVEQGVPPSEVVVLTPFLSDALRFSLLKRLQDQNVPVRSHRPSRALREEPAVQCLLTCAAVAHPQWGLVPTLGEMTSTVTQAIAGLDLVRGGLLVGAGYQPPAQGEPATLLPFDQLDSRLQDRITYTLGSRYDAVRGWLEAYREGPTVPLDHFLSRLFGEVLSQPSFGFHTSVDAGRTVASLVESVRKFRWVAGSHLRAEQLDPGGEYVRMVREGVIAAQYIQSWQHADADAVLLAPAWTFLTSNRVVDYQFWLDVGSRGWFERLSQPLTHPYVLSRSWPRERPWGEDDEAQADRDRLRALVLGLLRRCRKKVYLGLSELNDHGIEQRGDLLRHLDRVLRRAAGQQRGPSASQEGTS